MAFCCCTQNTMAMTSDHVWMLLTCEGGPSGCPEEALMWEGVSKQLRGIVWCATLDSTAKGAPKGGSGPTVFAYQHGKAKKAEILEGKREPKIYKHDMTVEDIVEWATDFLPKRDEGVDSTSFETFIQKR